MAFFLNIIKKKKTKQNNTAIAQHPTHELGLCFIVSVFLSWRVGTDLPRIIRIVLAYSDESSASQDRKQHQLSECVYSALTAWSLYTHWNTAVHCFPCCSSLYSLLFSYIHMSHFSVKLSDCESHTASRASKLFDDFEDGNGRERSRMWVRTATLTHIIIIWSLLIPYLGNSSVNGRSAVNRRQECGIEPMTLC